MPDPASDADQPAPETPLAVPKRAQQDEHMEEEEKVLAGRADANMPALLTKDVPGG